MTFNQAAEVPIDSRHWVAVAILYQNGNFLMQLRDDNPAILYPGYWTFFGGHLEPGESPDPGVRRELMEEIGYCPPVLNLFDRYEDENVVRYLFHGELDKDLDQLTLGEGMDMEWVTLEDIQRGDRYSNKINQVRRLGKPHRQILLDFIAANPQIVIAKSSSEAITLQVNGKVQTCPPNTVLPIFLEQLGLNPRLVAVEYNGEILHRQFWQTTAMKMGDRLEIVTIVGGG